MTLPHFLLLIAAVVLAAAGTLWAFAAAGLPVPLLALAGVALAGVARLWARVE